MSIVVVNLGLVAQVTALRDACRSALRIGLFQNDWVPARSSTVAEVVPCTFSGYDGLRTIADWGTPTLIGDRVVMAAAVETWVHDGGTNSNWVIGYYVVDLSGTLQWAERRPGGSVPMYGAGQEVAVIPQFSLRSQFPLVE